MTKEEFINTIKFWTINGNKNQEVLLYDFNIFLESNVCIPKGVNRHPYADVYHAYAEGTPVQHSFDNGITWIDTIETTTIRRIKPSEPVCEWQWKYKDDNTKLWTYSKYMTDAEFNSFEYCSVDIATKDEETKRVRL